MRCPCGAEYEEGSYEYLQHRGCRLKEIFKSQTKDGLLFIDISKPKNRVRNRAK